MQFFNKLIYYHFCDELKKEVDDSIMHLNRLLEISQDEARKLEKFFDDVEQVIEMTRTACLAANRLSCSTDSSLILATGPIYHGQCPERHVLAGKAKLLKQHLIWGRCAKTVDAHHVSLEADVSFPSWVDRSMPTGVSARSIRSPTSTVRTTIASNWST